MNIEMIGFPHLFPCFLKQCVGWVSAIIWQRMREQRGRCCPSALSLWSELIQLWL